MPHSSWTSGLASLAYIAAHPLSPLVDSRSPPSEVVESTNGLVESTSGLAESTSEVVESTSGLAESTNGLVEST
jgi:hypothetical protein